MTDDLQDSQSQPPLTAQQLKNAQQFKDEMLKLLVGNLTEEEEREQESILAGDEDALEYFLLRCALRRCI